MLRTYFEAESIGYNNSEVMFVQGLVNVANVSLDVEQEIPAHELRLMEEQFEEFCLEREAV